MNTKCLKRAKYQKFILNLKNKKCHFQSHLRKLDPVGVITVPSQNFLYTSRIVPRFVFNALSHKTKSKALLCSLPLELRSQAILTSDTFLNTAYKCHWFYLFL